MSESHIWRGHAAFVTDANGQFVAADLNPGRYKVELRAGRDSPASSAPTSASSLGRTFEVNTEMGVSGVTETVQVTADASPLVDNRSTLIAHNVTPRSSIGCPKARSFQSLVHRLRR